MSVWSRSRRRRVERQLAGLLEPDEEITVVERLPVGGWWLTTDRALFLLEAGADTRRVPLDQISWVGMDETTRIVTIRTTKPDRVVVPIRKKSAVLENLRRLAPPAGEDQS